MTSGHIPLVIELNMHKRKNITREQNYRSEIYNFNRANWTLFNSYLPDSAHVLEDVEKLNEFVLNSLIDAANIAIPLKYKNVKVEHLKSLPKHILQLIKTRKHYRRKKIKNNSVEKKKMYNYLTDEIRVEIKTLKNKEWLDFLDKQGKNPLSTKPFWQRINKLKGNKI